MFIFHWNNAFEFRRESQKTLKDIKDLEATIADSAALRSTARQVQMNTASKAQVIQSITSQVGQVDYKIEKLV